MPEAFFHHFLLYFLHLMKMKYYLLLNYFFVYGQSPFNRILTPWGQRLLYGLFIAQSLVSKEFLHTWKMFNKGLFKELTGERTHYSQDSRKQNELPTTLEMVCNDIIPRFWNYLAKRLDKASHDTSHWDVSFLCQGSQNSYLKHISCWAMKIQIYKLGFFYFFLQKKLVKLWKWKPLSLYDYCSLLSKMDFRHRNISPSNGAFQNHCLTFSLMQVQMPPDSWRFEAC